MIYNFIKLQSYKYKYKILIKDNCQFNMESHENDFTKVVILRLERVVIVIAITNGRKKGER
jgi:hypothetical protein